MRVRIVRKLADFVNGIDLSHCTTGDLVDLPGTHKRNSIEGPAYWSIDLALSRRIPLGAAQNVELRVETFNLLNHFNWGNPGPAVGGGGGGNPNVPTTANFDAGNFGQITTQAGTPRIFQFGIKYMF